MPEDCIKINNRSSAPVDDKIIKNSVTNQSKFRVHSLIQSSLHKQNNMSQQNYANHSQMVPGFHYVAGALWLALFIGSLVNLFHSTPDTHYSAALIVVTNILIVLIAYYARSFALKAQDRAIRAEENFRHYVLTGKPLNSSLRMSQIIALRFASDAEFVALAQKAADENLSAKAIKESIQNWKADTYRV
jgi:hypothetical protein